METDLTKTVNKDQDRIQHARTCEKKFWDKFARFYDGFMKNSQKTYDVIIEKIRSELKRSAKVLDVAAGTGIISLAIADQVKSVEGIDISEEMIAIAAQKARAKRLANVTFTVGDSYKLPYPSGSFDAVIISNVLHVMIDPAKALGEIQRVLADNGLLVASTYCHGENVKSRIVSRIMSVAGFKAYHKWTVDGYKEFIIKNEFDIIDETIIKDKIPLVFLTAKKKRK